MLAALTVGCTRAIVAAMSSLDLFKRIGVDPDVSAAFDRIPNTLNERGYDQWGFHPESAKVLYSLGRKVYNYFRPVVTGIENIPSGRVLIVPNHSGQLPFDAMVTAVACLLESNPPRAVRSMAERWFPTLPFVNMAFSRSGVVVGDPINCRNLLEAENAILVFPEGARGSGKTWDRRYQLERFGRGFMRLALQTGAPIVPVSIVGAEESIVSLYDVKWLAKLLGMPYFPIPPLLPLLGPLAMVPMPTRFYLDFGAPMVFDGPFDDEDEVIEEKVDVVRARIQSMIDDRLDKRPGVFA
ncbi:MAG: 1-acyl-sn-glycerol-3-phosphate acyltransferase [Myxococcota bacterium]|jgi:1-acyl-sn-glycerol-3-phosphate acyltransferase